MALFDSLQHGDWDFPALANLLHPASIELIDFGLYDRRSFRRTAPPLRPRLPAT
jgi:hypothetical protein